MSSEKSNVPRFYVASKIKNMVKNIPNISPMGGKGKPVSAANAVDNRDNDTIHSFHITESQQKPFLDCDALFTDCEEFLKLSHRAIEINNSNKGKSGLSKFVNSIPMTEKASKWRSKKKGNDLYENYEGIQGKMEHIVETLGEIANVSATTTSALITQSVHLNVRLTACVDYNRAEVDKNKPLVAEARAYLNKLKSTEKSISAMIDFLEEVNELKRTEPKPYVPWALRQQYDDEQEAERKAALARNEMVELKRTSLERRLRKVRKIIGPVERLFNITEQQQHTRLNNLSHCLRSQLALLNFLHRCQATGGSVQALLANAATNANPSAPSRPAAQALPVPPAPATQASPQATPKSGGFMNFANPIKALQHKSGTASAPGSIKGSPAPAPSASSQAYKPTLAELASGMVTSGPGSSRLSTTNSDRGNESSNPGSLRSSEITGAAAKGAIASVENASFDHDDSDSGDDEDEGDDADDPANPDNAIEKAVRHMRVALHSLQRNSGLVLEKVEPYDHRDCSDCAVVYDMANDCCMHIAAANFRSKQCAERMLRLSTYKDRMKENADTLDAQEPA